MYKNSGDIVIVIADEIKSVTNTYLSILLLLFIISLKIF